MSQGVFGKKEGFAPLVCDTPYNPNANSWWEIQEKVFTRWCNTHLNKREQELPMGGMLRGGLDSGIILWELLAEISNKEDELGRPNRKPAMRIHKVNNLLISLQFLDREKVKLVNIGAEDLVDRKLNLILGLIWTLILRYQIQKGKADAMGSAKNELLKWLNSIGIKVKDLTHDWSDGKQICNLINKIRDGLIPDDKIGGVPLENIQQAIDIASDEFDIPRVIDATDMASSEPDELVNMTYLSYFRDKWDELKAMASAELLGDNPRTVKAKKPVTFSLSTYNVTSPGQITVNVLDKTTGKPVPAGNYVAPKIVPGKKDQWDVTFTPLREGNLSVDLFVNGKPVKNAPLVLFLTPPAFAKVLPGDRKAVATKPFKLQLQTTNVVPGELQVSVKDDKGKQIPFKIVDSGNGLQEIVFTPEEKGKVVVDIKLDGETIPGAPVEIEVTPKPWARLNKPTKPITASKTTDLIIDVINVKPEDLVVNIKDADGKSKPAPKIKDNGNGTFTLPWTPSDKGTQTLEILLDGKPIEGSPLTVSVDPAPWARLNKPESPPTASKPCKMTIDTINVKTPDLSAQLKDGKGKVIATPKITDKGNGKFELEFVPPEKGSNTIEVYLDGKQVEGSPMTFTVDPKPWAKIRTPEKDPVASKPFKLILDTINVKPADLEANILDSNGKPIAKPTLRDRGDGTIEVEFTPTDKGAHTVDIKLDGKPIEGSPMTLKVEPKPWAKLNRPKDPPTASKPCKMSLEVINVKPADLVARILDSNNNPLPGVTITDNKNGTFDLVFTPKDQGKVVVDVQLEGKHIEGSPMILTSDPKPWAKIRMPDKAPVAGKPFKMYLDTVNVKPKDLEGKITDALGKVSNPTIKDLGNGTYEIEFTPSDKGKVRVDINLEGKPVEGCPLTLDVDPKPWAKLTRPAADPVAAHPYTMKLEVINVKPSDLEVKVMDDKGNLVPAPKLKDNGNGTFDLTWTPEHKGSHTVIVNLEGKPVEGSPMKLSSEACPWARVIGPSERAPTATKEFSFKVETINVKPTDLAVTVKDNGGKVLVSPKEVKVQDNKDGTFDISMTIPTHGGAVCDVILEGKQIEGAPLRLNVAQKPAASLRGPSSLDAIATKPFKFTLDTVNVNPEDLDLKITDDKGKKIPFKLNMNDDGSIDVNFTPMEPGQLKANVNLDGLPIKGAPVTINVAPKPAAFYNGPRPVHATALKPCKITLDTVNLKPDGLFVDLRDRDGKQIPVKVKPIGADKMELEFTPVDQGQLLMDIKVDGERSAGAPIQIDVAPAPFARVIVPKEGPIADRPFALRLETINVKPTDLDVNLVDNNGKKIPFQLRDNGDGTFDVKFTPNAEGGLNANIKLDGKSIEGCPLSLTVSPAPWAAVIGPNPTTAIAKRLFKFEIEAINLLPDDLVINLIDKIGKRLPYRITDTGVKNGKKSVFDVKLKPRDVGMLKAEVNLEGSPILNAPLIINVTPEPSAKLLGDEGRHCKVNDTVKMLIEAVNLTPEDLKVHIVDKDGQKVKNFKLRDLKNGTFELSFVADKIIRYNVDILYVENEESIENCPATVDADPKTNWSDALKDLLADLSDEAKWFTLTPMSDLDHLETHKPCIFHIVPTSGKKLAATAVAFTPSVVTESGATVPALVTTIEDGKFMLRFVPLTKEKHKIDVQLSKKSINNSPLTIDISVQRSGFADNGGDRELKIGIAIDRTSAIVGVPFTFQITYESANPKLVTNKVTDPTGKVLATVQKEAINKKTRPDMTYDGTIDVLLTPEVKGVHNVRLYYEGAPTSGEPVAFEVNPTPIARVLGESNRSDAQVNVPFTIQVATVNVKAQLITVGIKGPEGKVIASLNLDPTGKDTIRSKFTESPGRPKNPNGVHDGLFDLTFTPKEQGRYVAMVFLDKKPIQGSPVNIDCGPSPTGSSALGATTSVQSSVARPYEPAAASSSSSIKTTTIQATPIQATPVAEPEPVKKKASSSHKSSKDKKDGDKKKSSSSSKDKKKEEPAPAAAPSAPKPESTSSKQKVEVATSTRTITRVTVGKSFTIRLAVAGSAGAPADAPIKEKGKKIAVAKVKPGTGDTYEITWTPTHAGVFSTILVINGAEVGGSSFEFEAFNVPITCRPVKNSDNIGPGLPCTITFAIDNATPSALSAVIRGSDGKLGTDVSTKRRSDGTWDVNFKPPESPSFTVELTADKTAVENKLTIQLV